MTDEQRHILASVIVASVLCGVISLALWGIIMAYFYAWPLFIAIVIVGGTVVTLWAFIWALFELGILEDDGCW